MRTRLLALLAFALSIVAMGSLHLLYLFLTVLFSYFALTKLHFFKQRWLAVLIFLVLLCAIIYGFGYFIREAIIALPRIADKSVPLAVEYASKLNIELPFTDVASLRSVVLGFAAQTPQLVAHVAHLTTRELAYLIIGIIVAISIFLDSSIDLNQGRYAIAKNAYSVYSSAIADRFKNFYRSFSVVMGAQMKISALNTLFTTIFVLSIGLPYFQVAIFVTFICGFFPIVGNLISNTVICGIALTISPTLAVASLVFLIALHKSEYFLNSKIIGAEIKNPTWLTMIGLIVGEVSLGIPGMILAPVFLHYLKLEGSKVEVQE